MKRLVGIPLVLVLAGCSPISTFTSAKNRYVSLAPTVPVTSAPLQPVTASGPAAAPENATAVLALPEGAGGLKTVREKNFVNGTRQEIILSTGPGVYGENVIDVSVRVNGRSSGSGRILEMGPPSQNGIRSEILSRFPDVRMNIVTRPMRNRFGPFGLAIGRHASGARCIFVWQWVDDLREFTPGVSGFTKFGALMGGKSLATSIRIRLCRANETVDQLAGYAEGLRVTARNAVERIVRMDRRDIASSGPQISGRAIAGTPALQPVGGSLESALAGRRSVAKGVSRKSPSHKSRSSSRSSRPRRADSAPDSYNRIKSYIPRRASEEAPASAPAPGGGRYLAPVEGAPPPATGIAAAPAYRPAASAVGLPPEAYRGPQR